MFNFPIKTKNIKLLIYTGLLFVLTLSVSGTSFAENVTPASSNGMSFVRNIGGASAGDALSAPSSIATDSLGNMYVVDIDRSKVLKYDPSGNYVSDIGDQSGDGKLDSPSSVAIDISRNYYVMDMDNDRVVKFDSDGNYVSQFGSTGSGDGQFEDAGYIALDSHGNVYVSDWGNHRISKFDRFGNFILHFGSEGSGDSYLEGPSGVTIDDSGKVYVADTNANSIKVFDSDGNYVSKFGSTGYGDGQLNDPTAVVIDASGNSFVSDWSNNRVQKFDTNGVYLSQYASDWDVSGDGQFSIIYNLGIGKDGLIYVPDMQNGRIVVLQDDDYVAPIDLDSDKDGVLDTIENAGPNNGDANNDGILDKYQTKVTTYKIDGTDSYTTLVNAGCSENSSVSGLSVSSLSATDSGFDYPFGLTDFTLQCQPGESANIEKFIFTNESADGFTVRKYRPATETYENLPGATVESLTIGSSQALKLSYSITDGGDLDDDGIVNGLISDPVGLAVVHIADQNTENMNSFGGLNNSGELNSSGGLNSLTGSKNSVSGTLATTGARGTSNQINFAVLFVFVGIGMALIRKYERVISLVRFRKN